MTEVEEFPVMTRGRTTWAPGTIKFVLYDHRRLNPIAIAIGGSAKEVRECPPTGPLFAAGEALAWKKHGAPLRAVAVVVVGKDGWYWKPYDGKLSWAKKEY